MSFVLELYLSHVTNSLYFYYMKFKKDKHLRWIREAKKAEIIHPSFSSSIFPLKNHRFPAPSLAPSSLDP